MIRWFYATLRRMEALFARKTAGSQPSQLVGMYLEHANRQASGGLRGATNRERQNGKFSMNRRRN